MLGKTVSLHGRATVRVQDQSARFDVLAFACCLDKGYRQISRFVFCQKVAGHVAAEDVYNDVEVKVGTGPWAFEPGDVPTPELIGSFCQ